MPLPVHPRPSPDGSRTRGRVGAAQSGGPPARVRRGRTGSRLTGGAPARPALLRLRLLLWRLRGAVALAVVGVAGVWTVRQMAPPPPVTVAVVVADREVQAGATLVADDLRVARVPVHLVPSAAVRDVRTLTGRTAAVGLSPGLPVTGSLVEGDRFTIDPPRDAVVVPVRLTATAALGLRPGDRVDLVVPAGGHRDPVAVAESTVATGEGPAVLAQAALVLEVSSHAAEDLTGLTSAGEDPVTWVAVTEAEGRGLAAGAAWGALGAVLVSG